MNKDFALQLLKQARRDHEYGGFEFGGVTWASETKDELRLNSAITLFIAARVFGMDGFDSIEGYVVNSETTITLTPEIAMGAAMKMFAHYGNVFAAEALKKIALAELPDATVEDWAAENLAQGWRHG